MPIPYDSPAELLARTGRKHLRSLASSLAKADPNGLVSPPAALLCCGLAALAETAATARGVTDTEAVGRAAAKLALLTKLDDEVIDDVAFHGGSATDRRLLHRRTTDFLAPTLRSLRTGVAETAEPRCHLAAELGRDLRTLAIDDARLEQLFALIARGWRVQADAVVTLSAGVGSVSLVEVERVTAEISGAWLAMVTYVGLLGAERGPHPHETAAFFSWGLHIQAADALADLRKDLGDQFVNTLPVVHAFHRAGAPLSQAVQAADAAGIEAQWVQTGSDLAVLPTLDQLRALDLHLGDLGRVPELMRWIHGFLLGRYLDRIGNHPQIDKFDPYLSSWTLWRPTHASEVACSAS
ncbi:MAG: hypothetical protein AB8H79_18215 [Myxococcota bacterium]